MYFKRIKTKNKKGFTLVETIIYITIFVLLSILVVNMIITIIKSAAMGYVSRNINTSAEAGIERMIREIRRANDIEVAESYFGVNPGVLKLDTTEWGSDATTTIKFQLENGILKVSEGGGALQALTSTDVNISSLIFYQIIASTTSKAIKVEMELEDSWSNYTKTEKFYNTTILRGSY